MFRRMDLFLSSSFFSSFSFIFEWIFQQFSLCFHYYGEEKKNQVIDIIISCETKNSLSHSRSHAHIRYLIQNFKKRCCSQWQCWCGTVAAKVTTAYCFSPLLLVFLRCLPIVFIQMSFNGNFNLRIQFTQLSATSEKKGEEEEGEKENKCELQQFSVFFSLCVQLC